MLKITQHQKYSHATQTRLECMYQGNLIHLKMCLNLEYNKTSEKKKNFEKEKLYIIKTLAVSAME